MNLLDILTPPCVKAPLDAKDKKGALDELVGLLADAGKVTDAAVLREAVWTREQIRTTGIGLGLAIPHGKCAGVANLALAIGKPGVPLEFGAIDNKPVRLIVLLASPPDRTSDHIQALAKVSKLMLGEAFREALYAAATGAEIFELIRKQEER
jgi:mannitol/fructose-specific phosphotransferase system IIA component (Ntr-type)